MDYQHSNNSVPLTLLALEVGTTADELAARLGDDVTIDDATGLRVVPAERARAYLAALRAAQQAQADRRAAAQEEARRRPNAVRERVRALQARQRAAQQLGAGEPIAVGQPLAILQELDGSRDERLDASAVKFDELARGAITYHPFREGQD